MALPILIRGDRCATSTELFSEWARALDFPASFRRDWDSFDELMGDLGWHPGDVVIRVEYANRLLEQEVEKRELLVEILDDVRSVLAGQGRRLEISFEAPARDADAMPELFLPFVNDSA